MAEITKKMLENANKVTFLIENYPGKTLEQLVGSLQMPSIDINTAIWTAVELGFIEDPSDGDELKLINKPETYQMGDTVEELKSMITFSFRQLTKKEQDLEETYMSNWTMGYAGHDVLIALKQLMNEHVIATYQLTDPKDTQSTYTFYSSYENSEQMWGRKQFKEQPTGEEQPTDDMPEEDKHLNEGNENA